MSGLFCPECMLFNYSYHGNSLMIFVHTQTIRKYDDGVKRLLLNTLMPGQ